MMRTLAVAFLFIAGTAAAQRPANFGQQTRRFISVDAPVVALVNLRDVDGTAAEPRENQEIVISGDPVKPGCVAPSMKTGSVISRRLELTEIVCGPPPPTLNAIVSRPGLPAAHS